GQKLVAAGQHTRHGKADGEIQQRPRGIRPDQPQNEIFRRHRGSPHRYQSGFLSDRAARRQLMIKRRLTDGRFHESRRFVTGTTAMAHAATMARRHRGSGVLARALVAAIGMVATALAAAPIAYMLWPAQTPVSLDAPALPVTIGNVLFNVPPAAIRFKAQRRTGAQPRVDLTFVWPSLAPPEPAVKPKPSDTPDVTDRLFVTI